VLVTPEDVAAAAEAELDEAAVDPPASESGDPSAADAADLALGSGIPPWWPVGVAVLAVLGLLAVRQRRRRSRGRYTA
jgi:hypothetical protein